MFATAVAVFAVPSLGGGVVTFVAFKIADLLIGLRVSEEEEREGQDITSHGETAYHS